MLGGNGAAGVLARGAEGDRRVLCERPGRQRGLGAILERDRAALGPSTSTTASSGGVIAAKRRHDRGGRRRGGVGLRNRGQRASSASEANARVVWCRKSCAT